MIVISNYRNLNQIDLSTNVKNIQIFWKLNKMKYLSMLKQWLNI